MEKIMEWETFKGLWPIGVMAVMSAFSIRVGQSLNRKDISHMRGDMERVEAQGRDDKRSLHARIDRHEKSTESTLTEIRTDIKELLRRGG